MKHTPGGWKYIKGLGEKFLIFGGLNYLCSVDSRVPPSENEANARLIAAAPELLEACLAMMRYQALIESEDETKSGLIAAYAEAFEGAEAAIAKARGEE